jgi:glycosyltransferase involved in cell wall biosynthesis
MDDNVSAFVTKKEIGKKLARFYIGKCYLPAFDFHIANSSYTAEELFNAVEKIPGHIRVSPRGTDCTLFTPEKRNEAVRKSLRELAGGDRYSILLFYVGRISPEKNIKLLVDTMEILARDKTRDYRLLVAGTGPLAAWLETESEKRAGGKIILLDHISNKEALAHIYANTDIFIHPNPREPFGIAPLEAMASGVPLVAPASGGLLSYANETNAWLTKASAESFVVVVRSVFKNLQARKEKINRARQTALDHSWEQSTARLFSFYDEFYEAFAKEEKEPRINADERELENKVKKQFA